MFPIQFLVLVDGRDCFTYTLSLPSGPTSSPKWQYYMAGGAVSRHTLERHIQLVNADTSLVSWRLASLQVLKGAFYIHVSLLYNTCIVHVQQYQHTYMLHVQLYLYIHCTCTVCIFNVDTCVNACVNACSVILGSQVSPPQLWAHCSMTWALTLRTATHRPCRRSWDGTGSAPHYTRQTILLSSANLL